MDILLKIVFIFVLLINTAALYIKLLVVEIEDDKVVDENGIHLPAKFFIVPIFTINFESLNTLGKIVALLSDMVLLPSGIVLCSIIYPTLAIIYLFKKFCVKEETTK